MSLADEIREWADQFGPARRWADTVERLERENEKLRGALERIAAPGNDTEALYFKSRLARTALSREELVEHRHVGTGSPHTGRAFATHDGYPEHTHDGVGKPRLFFKEKR